MRATAIGLLLLCCAGCQMPTGLIYSECTYPLTEDLTDTPNSVVIHEEGDVREVAEPFLAGIKVQWHTSALGDIARQCGMKEFHYADVEKLIILGFFFGGIWRQETVHLYGK